MKKPGYENTQYRLTEHQADNDYQYLFREAELSVIDSIPRIMKMKSESESMEAEKMNIFWNRKYAVHLRADLQAKTPFRKSYGSDRRYIYFPFSEIKKIKDIEDAGFKFIAYESLQQFYQEGGNRDLDSHEHLVASKISLEITQENPQVSRWLELDAKQEFSKICRQIKGRSYRSSAINFLTIELDQTKQFDFHPWLGFYHRGRV